MKKRKKTLYIFFVLVMLTMSIVAYLQGCGADSSTSSSNVSVTMKEIQ